MSAGNDETRLYGLMEVAEQQQAVVQAALEKFTAERAAWERERERLAREVRELQLTTQRTVRAAVKESLAGAATEGVAAVQAAAKPLLGRLTAVTESAGQAEAALRKMVLWASGRLLRRTVLAIAMVILLGWLANMAVLWWDAGAIGRLQARKVQLEADVPELQARKAQLEAAVAALQVNRDSWVRQGMLGKLERCGPTLRPCVRVDEKTGKFVTQEHDDYRVILGY